MDAFLQPYKNRTGKIINIINDFMVHICNVNFRNPMSQACASDGTCYGLYGLLTENDRGSFT